MADITNTDDIIDSRDILERIEELKSEIEAYAESMDDWQANADNESELELLEALAAQCEGYGDWEHGEALIHSDYFTEYTRQLLEDCGYIPADLPGWITIDWEDTADNVKADYIKVSFGGQAYFMRA